MKFELYPFENNIILLPDITKYEKSKDNYLTEDVFISFLEHLYSALSVDNVNSICLQPLFPNQSILETFIHVDLTDLTIRVPHKSYNYINNVCPSVSMIVIPIKLHLVNIQDSYSSYDQYNIDINDIDLDIVDQFFNPSKPLTTAHSNLLLIDNYNKTIEYFEPHGLNLGHASAGIVSINNIIYKSAIQLFPFASLYSFNNASNSCIIGVQTMQSFVDNKAGHCLAWSLFFLTLRLFNQKLVVLNESSSEFIHRFLVSFPAIQLDDIVRRFITYVKTFPMTEKAYSNYLNFNIHASLSPNEKANIEERLKHVGDVYFQKLLNSSTQDISVLFAELISYRNLPSFHLIMSQCMKQVVLRDKEKIVDIANNQQLINDTVMFSNQPLAFDFNDSNDLYNLLYNSDA